MLVIGLMSGTSADAVDAALVEWPDGRDGREARPFTLRAFREDPMDPALRERIHALAAGEVAGPDALRELAALDVALADVFAASARRIAGEAGVELADVAAIASHGQTVAHHPELGATLQVGDPSRIAERAGCMVVADFRARDMAAGGEGAPLAPFFHHAAFTSPDESRAVLNLGGIANLTGLPAGAAPDDVVAFDVGPANVLLDEAVRLLTDGSEPFDRDGARAARGSVDAALLARLLDDEYLRRPPPKSTGRERYGRKEAQALVRDWAGAADDLLATLTAFSARAVADACRDFLPAPPARLIVCGGGARNPTGLAALARALPGLAVETSDAHGVPPDAVEAMAFSLMGRNALLGLPNHLPRTTGARRAVVLGEVVPR